MVVQTQEVMDSLGEDLGAHEALMDLDLILARLSGDHPARMPLVRLRAAYAVAAGLPLLAALPPQ